MENLSTDTLARITFFLDAAQALLFYSAGSQLLRTKLAQYGGMSTITLNMEQLRRNRRAREVIIFDAAVEGVFHSFQIPRAIYQLKGLTTFELILPYLGDGPNKSMVRRLPPSLTKLNLWLPSVHSLFSATDLLAIEVRPEGRYPDAWLPLSTMFPRLAWLEMKNSLSGIRQTVPQHFIIDFLASLPPTITHMHVFFLSSLEPEALAMLPPDLSSISLRPPFGRALSINALTAAALGPKLLSLDLSGHTTDQETQLVHFKSLTYLSAGALSIEQIQVLPPTMVTLKCRCDKPMQQDYHLRWRVALPKSITDFTDLTHSVSVQAHLVLPPNLIHLNCAPQDPSDMSYYSSAEIYAVYPPTLTSLDISPRISPDEIREPRPYSHHMRNPIRPGFHFANDSPNELRFFTAYIYYNDISPADINCMRFIRTIDVPFSTWLDVTLQDLPPGLTSVRIGDVRMTGALLDPTDFTTQHSKLSQMIANDHIGSWIEKNLSPKMFFKRVSLRVLLAKNLSSCPPYVTEMDPELIDAKNERALSDLPRHLTSLDWNYTVSLADWKGCPPNLTRLNLGHGIDLAAFKLLPSTLLSLVNTSVALTTEEILENMNLVSEWSSSSSLAVQVKFPEDLFKILIALRPQITLDHSVCAGEVNDDCLIKLPPHLTSLKLNLNQKCSLKSLLLVGGMPRFPLLATLETRSEFTSRILGKALSVMPNLTSLSLLNSEHFRINPLQVPPTVRSLTILQITSLSHYNLPITLDSLIIDECVKFATEDWKEVSNLIQLRTLVFRWWRFSPNIRDLKECNPFLPTSLTHVEIDGLKHNE
jgi:hypothetical protein